MVDTAFNRGWDRLENGELLQAAEDADFALLITTDQNLKYQQNFAGRKLAILVLPTTNWLLLQKHTASILAAAKALRPGDFVELRLPG